MRRSLILFAGCRFLGKAAGVNASPLQMLSANIFIFSNLRNVLFSYPQQIYINLVHLIVAAVYAPTSANFMFANVDDEDG